MTQETENLVLELLRRMRDEMREEFTEVKLRLSSVEQGIGNLGMSVSQLQVTMGSFHRRTDRLETRAEGLEAASSGSKVIVQRPTSGLPASKRN